MMRSSGEWPRYARTVDRLPLRFVDFFLATGRETLFGGDCLRDFVALRADLVVLAAGFFAVDFFLVVLRAAAGFGLADDFAATRLAWVFVGARRAGAAFFAAGRLPACS